MRIQFRVHTNESNIIRNGEYISRRILIKSRSDSANACQIAGIFQWNNTTIDCDTVKWIKCLATASLQIYVEKLANFNLFAITKDCKNVDFSVVKTFPCDSRGLIVDADLATHHFQITAKFFDDPHEVQTLFWENALLDETHGKKPTIKELLRWCVISRTTDLLASDLGLFDHSSKIASASNPALKHY
jgi:hypothetical protein